MEQCNVLPAAFLCMIFVTLTIIPSSADDLQQQFLDSQNKAREEVGVPKMEWDSEVAATAQRYAEQRKDCNLVHSNGPYGENIAMGFGDFTVENAVKIWLDEKQFYDYSTNTCSAPAGGTCLHYTQVVWRDSVKVGCAKVTCDKGGFFIVCNYSPPGNYIGTKPY